jgi:hypothetical protein
MTKILFTRIGSTPLKIGQIYFFMSLLLIPKGLSTKKGCCSHPFSLLIKLKLWQGCFHRLLLLRLYFSYKKHIHLFIISSHLGSGYSVFN